jgi:hypothetical protein
MSTQIVTAACYRRQSAHAVASWCPDRAVFSASFPEILSEDVVHANATQVPPPKALLRKPAGKNVLRGDDENQWQLPDPHHPAAQQVCCWPSKGVVGL